MARNSGFTVENNFSNGLVTEATGLNFPENAVTDTDNCIFDRQGVVSRRQGIDTEVGSVKKAIPIADQVYTEYLWESVAGDGNITLFVQQVGNLLHFYRSTGGDTLSAQFLQTVDISFFGLVGASTLATQFCQFSAGLGRLIVVHPNCNPFYVQYDKATTFLTAAQITINTRDFKGVEPQEVPRLTTRTASHSYNLYNQGWLVSRQDDYFSKAGFFPSDFEVWWLYKSPDAFGTEVFLTNIAVSSGILNNLDRGNSPAPKGSVVLSEFYQDRSAASGVIGIPVVTAGVNRPSTTAFHAGRVFYAGTNAEDFSTKVYFSQILEGTKQFGRCYQENDPTSQFTPDLLPTDGGVIAIPDIGTVYKLWSVDNNLLVHGSQGVWLITGSQGIGFSATDYTVKKISSAPTLSGHSFVNVDGMPLWWSYDDIFIGAAESSIGVAIKSVSNQKIKDFFQDIPEESKRFAKGAFNNRDRVAQWLYRDTPADTNEERQDYNRILNLNVDAEAYYPWTISNPVAKFRGIFVVKGQGSQLVPTEVTTLAGDNVLDAALNNVIVSTELRFTLSSQFKYTVVIGTNQMTFAEESESEVIEDFPSEVGGPVDFNSYFDAGYRVRGDAIKKFQSSYFRVFVDGSVVQDFFVSGRWNFSKSGNTGKWSSRQRLEFDDPDNYSYLSRRVKIRGAGLALQFRIDSALKSNFNIVGWSTWETGNTQV